MIIQRMLIFRGVVALCLWSALAGCENMDAVTQPSTETPSGAQADTGTSNGGERLIASHQGLSATVPKNFSCADSVQVIVYAPDETAFTGDRIKLQRLIGGVRGKFGFDCPLVRNIMIVGRVDDRDIYQGIVSDKNNWVLVDTQRPVWAENPPPAVAYVREPPESIVEAVPAPTSRMVQDVTECDRLAAHPSDPNAVSAGVSDEQMDVLSAITACEAAVRADPVPRLQFQLARGYLKADRIEDAIEQFVIAAEQGHGGALAYLGDFHLEGVPGIEADPILARSLYQRAVEAGFAPAKAVLDQFEDYTEQFAQAEQGEQIPSEESQFEQSGRAITNAAFNASGYNNPQIVSLIYQGDLDGIPFGEAYTKLYLLDMAENIAGVCETHFTRSEVDRLRNAEGMRQLDTSNPGASIMGVLGMMADMTKDPFKFVQQGSQAESDQERRPDEAMKDAFTLIKREQCGSANLDRFSLNLRAFVNNEGAPFVSMREMSNICTQQAGSSGKYTRRDFCTCFTGKMRLIAVTRAQRKALAADFWPTAKEMMKNNRTLAVCYTGY